MTKEMVNSVNGPRSCFACGELSFSSPEESPNRMRKIYVRPDGKKLMESIMLGTVTEFSYIESKVKEIAIDKGQDYKKDVLNKSLFE